ncbi:TIGR00297 family protein [Halogranum gelatinilyticum]|uniref:TIGR00297 family protein n=1 Tax=Halogranum gelatinilyticum TaxID=660521 RepID=A0A1G9TUX9_9EURY|nr:DUF92 domain-containing protein [Halogranum gelatinilyticum]SDM51472.1 TIGR00297 family protein [Halogranum gelatinilyticum]
MTSTLRRAGGFAAVGTLSLAAPILGAAAAVPFAVIAALAAFVVDDGPLFELFARPGDYEDRRLNGLAGFSLAATGLALLATVLTDPMPVSLFVTAVLVLAYGNLGERFVGDYSDDPFIGTLGFTVVGFLAGTVGQVATASVTTTSIDPAVAAFLASTGALVAALLRSVLYERDDPLVMLSVGLLLWFFAQLVTTIPPLEIVGALAVMVVLGYASYALGTASVTGMLAGVLLGVLTIILGGFGWFAVLIAFFGVGGLSTKFKYDDKLDRGVAEDNEGARGSGNVLGNAAVALFAVIGFAASEMVMLPGTLFLFAFTGSLATAMSDTLSSEIGGLFDTPRLITTLERVPPGTDGGVTWQGELAGIAGAALVAAIAVVSLPIADPLFGALVIVGGGLGGMTVDSLLGATVEGDRIGNQSVNFLATLAGAVVSVVLAVVLL